MQLLDLVQNRVIALEAFQQLVERHRESPFSGRDGIGPAELIAQVGGQSSTRGVHAVGASSGVSPFRLEMAACICATSTRTAPTKAVLVSGWPSSVGAA